MGWLRRLRNTWAGSTGEPGFEEEARFHIERRAEALVREGMAPDAARETAVLRFGNVTLTRERTRDADTFRWLTDLGADLRYAVRVLRRTPGFSAIAIITLALGIGANTAIFAAAYGVLLRPLPYRDADRLVRLSEYHAGAHSPLSDAYLSNLTYTAWRDHARTLDGMAAFGERAYAVTGAGDAERVRGAAVSPAFFHLLGVSPAAGRFFTEDEAIEGAGDVVVLSYGYWQRMFGGRRDAIGQRLTLDRRPHTIVGVAPDRFMFMNSDQELFTPFVMPDPSRVAPVENRGRRNAPLPREVADERLRRVVSVFFAIGRLAPGVTTAQAEAEGTAAARSTGPRPVAAEMLFGKGGQVAVRVEGFVAQMTTAARPVLLLLVCGVALVLLLGCANVASLLLSRGVARERELAVRAAIGAGRGRLLRQLLAESLALAIGATLLGVLLAWGLVYAWPALAPRRFPRIDQVRLDGLALLVALAASLVASALVGIAPALHGSRVNLLTGLRDAIGSAGAVGGGRATRTRRGLLIVQAAFAVVLLVGATLLVRSFDRLVSRDMGYDAAQVITARVSLQGGEVNGTRWRQLATAIVDRVKGLPGVDEVGASNMAPLGDSTHLIGFELRGDRPESIIARALGYAITPRVAQALHLRLRQGRTFVDADATSATQPLLVNEAFVRAYFTDGRPVVGRRYQDMLKPDAPSEIVGVVGDVLRNGVLDLPQPEIYAPVGNNGSIGTANDIYITIRGHGDMRPLADGLRAIVREVDPSAPVHAVRSLAEQLAASAGESRFAATVLSVFAGLAVLLAAIGLYGALLYAVTRRTRELGIRRALGATRAGLIALVMREGLIVTAAGLLLGLIAAAVGARLLRGLLYGVDPLDIVSFTLAPALLALIALAACALPAWRATAIAPTEALRQD